MPVRARPTAVFRDRRHPQGRLGFTLIELLVVVTIIIALLAILLPSINRAMKAAERVVCGSNEHQLAAAMMGYIAEHRTYPGHHWVAQSKMAWPVRLRPYAGGDHDVFFCPSNDQKHRWAVTHNTSAQLQTDGYYVGETILTSASGFSYGYNDWGIKDFAQPHLGLGGHVGDPAHTLFAASQVAQPSDMIAIADSRSDNYWDLNIDPTPSLLGPQGQSDEPGQRHDGGANTVFADGHVRWIHFDELMRKDTESTKRWNNDNLPHPEYWAY